MRPSPGAGGGVARPVAAGDTANAAGVAGMRPQSSFQPESRSQVQVDANRGAQSRASPQRPRGLSSVRPRAGTAMALTGVAVVVAAGAVVVAAAVVARVVAAAAWWWRRGPGRGR
jgi:hypothetical protein